MDVGQVMWVTVSDRTIKGCRGDACTVDDQVRTDETDERAIIKRDNQDSDKTR